MNELINKIVIVLLMTAAVSGCSLRGDIWSQSSKSTNHKPVISSFVSSASTIEKGDTVNLVADVSDQDGDTLKYKYEITKGIGTLSGPDDMKSKTFVFPSDQPAQEVKIKLTVDDGWGGRADAEIALSVRTSWIPVGSSGFTPGAVQSVSFVVKLKNLYVAFSDMAAGSKASMMKYEPTGKTWSFVGSQGFSASAATSVSLDLYMGIPYVAYNDTYNSGRMTVKRFNGSQWVLAGTAGFGGDSAFGADNVNLVINTTGAMYSVCRNLNGNKADTFRYDVTKNDWESTGSSPKQSNSLSMKSINDVPTVALMDISASPVVAFVAYYNGTSWTDLGPYPMSSVNASNLSLASDNTSTYLAFSDNSQGGRSGVRHYNGTEWEDCGLVSTGSTSRNSLIVKDGIPYLACNDSSYGSSVVVYKLNGSIWQMVGKPVSKGLSSYFGLAFDSEGDLYLAYNDEANGGKLSVSKFK